MRRIWPISWQRSIPPRRPTRRRRRLLAAGLVLALGVMVLSGRFPQEPLRGFVESRLQRSVGPESRLGTLHVVPGRLEAELWNVVIVGPGLRAELPHVRVRLSATALLHAGLVLRSLEVERPHIALSVVTPPPPPSTLEAPRIAALQVSEGTLEYHDPALGGDVTLYGIRAQGSVGQGELELTASGGEWRRATPVPLAPIVARLKVSPALDLDIASLQAGTAGSSLRLSGRAGASAQSPLDLRVELDLDLAEGRSFDLPPASGQLRATARVQGWSEAPRIEADVHGRELVVAERKLDKLEAHLQQDPKGGAQFQLALSALGGRGEGSGTLNGNQIALNLKASDVRLERALVSGSPIAGAVSGDLRAEGDLKGLVRVSGALRASGSDASGGKDRLESTLSGWLKPVEKRVALDWNASGERTTAATGNAPATSLAVTAAGTAAGAFPTPTLEGHFTGHAVSGSPQGPLDLPVNGTLSATGDRVRLELQGEGPVGKLRASLLSAGSRIERLEVHGNDVDLAPFLGAGAGRLQLDADLSGTPPRLSGSVSAHAQDLVFKAQSLGTADANLRLNDGQGRLEVHAPGLSLNGDAELQLAGGGRAHGSVRLAGTPLASLATLGGQPAGPEPIEGELTATADFDARFDRLADAEIDAKVEEIKARKGDLALHATPFTMKASRGAAQLEGLSVDVNGTHAEISGRIAEAPQPSDIQVHVTADLGKLPPVGSWQPAGTATGDAHLSGTLDRPSLVGSVELRELQVSRTGGSALASLPSGRIDLRGDSIAWQGIEASLANGSLATSGEVPLAALVARLRSRATVATGAESARVELSWKGIDLAQLLGALQPGSQQSAEGVLGGELQLRGGLSKLGEAQGQLKLDPIAARVAGAELKTEAVTAEIAGGVLTVPSLTIQSGSESLVAAARADLAHGSLEASAQGRLDLRALTPLSPELALAGTADVDVKLHGPMSALDGGGSLTLDGVSLRSRSFPQPLTDIKARLTLSKTAVDVQSFSGRLGGGTVEGSGQAQLSGASLASLDLKLAARDLSLRYPGSFQSRLSANLTLRGPAQSLQLAGDVQVERGLYDQDVFLDSALLSAARLPAAAELPPFLSAIGLDVQVSTQSPIRVRNNLSDLGVTGRIRVRGDIGNPEPLGRLEVGEGGIVYLQTRKFTVDRGSLSYEGTLDPDISIRAETVIRDPSATETGDITVTIAADGPLQSPDLKLTSDPSYSERELASLIATGRLSVALDSSAWVAGEQTAALLAGRLTRNVTKGLMDLGLDEVEIQPELLAREADPGARFTFGKHVSPRIKLIYSLGLNDPEATYYAAEYTFRRGVAVTARILRDVEGTYGGGLGQRLRWGAPRRESRRPRDRSRGVLTSVQFAGDAAVPEPELREWTKLKAGDRASYFELTDKAERVERRLREAGHVEAMVSVRKDGEGVVFDVQAGPLYRWEVQGLPGAPDLTTAIHEARFEGDAVDRGRTRLLDAARHQGYPRASVEVVPEGDAVQRTLSFRVSLGPSLRLDSVAFPGSHELSEKRLLEAAGGPSELLLNPAQARARLLQEYRHQNFLVAEVGELAVVESAGELRLSVPVSEGPKARIASVRFTGQSPPDSVLLPLANLEPGAIYDATKLPEAVQRIRNWYLKGGFASARVTPRADPTALETPGGPTGANLDVVFAVNEGDATTIGATTVRGLRRTRESLVRGRIEWKEGEPLDPRRLVQLERRLLDLNVFSRVVVTAAQDENPASIDIEVEERGPYSIAYDLRFSPSEGASALLDGEVGNLAGTGTTLGARYRRGEFVREERGSLVIPALGHDRGLTLTVFQREEDFKLANELDGGLFPPILASDTEIRRGFDIQQSRKLPSAWALLYGYHFERVSSRVVTSFREDISELQGSVVRETRDNPLDARRGYLLSLHLDVSPQALGSNPAFFRSMAQLFFNHSFSPSWTWSQGYRVGLANGLAEKEAEDQRIFGRSEELFRAGGGNSLRGFASESVGPKGVISGISAGGEAVILLNQELRYHHPSGLGAALFYDTGNVFAHISDISFDLRQSAGFGLRYSSPLGLVRLDIGFPLDRRTGERPYQWFFSIGQAF